jgi:2-keto-4-pentenoate hydratase/2-oxohepta-3-ene-1,7-dioic acid hydratase in catechol pathway
MTDNDAGWTMKLASFLDRGEEFFGVVIGDGVLTMNERIGQPTLRDALAAGALGRMHALAQTTKPDRKLSEIAFLPVIPCPGKILCAGINYRAHAAEAGGAEHVRAVSRHARRP